LWEIGKITPVRIKDIIGVNVTRVKIELMREALSLGEVYIKIG